MTPIGGRDLKTVIREEIDLSVPSEISAMAEFLQKRYGNGVRAIVFYGSCLRRGHREGDVIDFYVIVDGYREIFDSMLNAALNWLLPPNVVYVETTYNGNVLRGKCASISFRDFERGVSGKWFHSYMWARFSQPCRVLYLRNEEDKSQISITLSNAVKTMVRETLPLMSGHFTSSDLWVEALKQTYRAELRAESSLQASELIKFDEFRYQNLTRLLCDENRLSFYIDSNGTEDFYRSSSSPAMRQMAKFRWQFRRVIGKALSVFRLVKAAFTFEDGASYILWKIERHSGVKVDLSDWQRRHPILASTSLFWRLYLKGAFK